MNPFELFSVIGISLTALLGFYNLFLNIKSQRKSQRDLIFNKQIDFFVDLQNLMARFERTYFDLFKNGIEYKLFKIEILKIADEIDLAVSQNEWLIPDDLFKSINEFSVQCYKIIISLEEKPKTEELKEKVIKNSVSLIDDIREYIGIEKLSKENLDLIHGRNKNPLI